MKMCYAAFTKGTPRSDLLTPVTLQGVAEIFALVARSRPDGRGIEDVIAGIAVAGR